ncbi:MAG TPA: trehalose-6-phosphate synthase [Mycobacteriales bacterium]|jgi:trehalose 6-phosphate synthase|nr:trehalose-6-phosphate synthase [Mycobacteriales bacterium]
MPDPVLDLPVVLLSHRGPVSFAAEEGGGRTATRGAGGLVTALTGLTAHLPDAVWVCVATPGEDAVVAREADGQVLRLALGPPARLLEPEEPDDPDDVVHVRLVEVPAEVHEPFYGVIANPLLWFVQHRLYGLATAPTLGRAEHAAWTDGYVEANRLAAEAVVEQVERAGGRAAVMLHDYHFYLVGDLVRQRCPDVLLSHFVHIPWPGPDAWRVLPPAMREAVLRGLLGCDVVGFHTGADARSFLLCAQELLGLPVDLEEGSVLLADRQVRARTYPISIDVAGLEEVARSQDTVDHLAQLPGHGQLVLRVDRTDPSKNIVRGFDAFELLLEEHPEQQGEVVFLALLQSSRQDVPEYAAYLTEIGAAAARINAKFGTGTWQPVDLRLASDLPLAVAAYRRCDVLVVNAVADGMNLVAKEAVVVNERDMVLALSESTGAHGELGRYAVTLHPFDIAQQADAIHEALTMPHAERAQRRRQAADQVRRNDVRRWLRVQLADLAGIAAEED